MTTAFRAAAEARAAALGLPAHPRVETGHPIASRNADDIRAMARAALDQVVAGLLGTR